MRGGRIHSLWSDHRTRYIVVGLVILGSNLAVARIAFSFDLFLSTALWRNIGNALVTEIAVITAFFLHRRFTWSSEDPQILRVMLRFHAVTGVGLVGRLTAFALLDAASVAPMLATLLSIPVAIIVNYFGYDRLVFKRAQAAAAEDTNATRQA